MNAALTRIIGIGQANAGDDYAGIAIARALREQTLPAGVEVHEITDPSRLVELLDGIRCAILVDALVTDDCPGNILRLVPKDLAAYPFTPLSSHGTSVADAIGLARLLAPNTVGRDIRIIGITIAPPVPYSNTLSSPVAAALPRAVSLILNLLEDNKALN